MLKDDFWDFEAVLSIRSFPPELAIEKNSADKQRNQDLVQVLADVEDNLECQLNPKDCLECSLVTCHDTSQE